MLTQIQNEQLEVGEDIEEDKRRTMFTCDDCGSWFLSMQKYKEHACYKKGYYLLTSHLFSAVN